MSKYIDDIKKIEGFTLIEIMVSMVISSLVIAGVYGVYTIQQRSYTVQEQVSEMQQRIRTAVDFMSRDMRMAGYAPPQTPYDANGVCGDAAISVAQPKRFVFSYCNVIKDENGSFSSSLVTSDYSFYDAYNDNNGRPDAIGIIRNNGSITPVVEGVDAIEFLYLDRDRTQTTIIDNIRAVEISILVRSTYPDMKYTDTVVYTPRSGDNTWGGTFKANPPNDNYHRRLLITTIYLRNMGVQQ